MGCPGAENPGVVRMYETNWVERIAAFDAKFGDSHIRERYQTLEDTLQRDDLVFSLSSFSSVLECLTEAMRDAQEFATIIPRLTTGSAKKHYVASVAEYAAAQEIAARIKTSLLPTYITMLWETRTRNSELFRQEDKDILLRIVQFYEDCANAFGAASSLAGIPLEIESDMRQWHTQYQHTALFCERAHALLEHYRTTFFPTKEALLVFVKDAVQPLQRENEQAMRIQRIKKYYPRAEGVQTLYSEIKEEIKHFAVLQKQQHEIQEKIKAMNSATASLQQVILEKLSLQGVSSLLATCNQDYASKYSIHPACPKFAPLEEAYTVAYATYTMKRDAWLSQNKEQITSRVVDCASKEMLYEDRIAIKEISGIIGEIEAKTHLLFGSEISDRVTALETAEHLLQQKRVDETSYAAAPPLPKSSLLYAMHHPLWVAQQLEAFPEQKIPPTYRSLHNALLVGSRIAVVRTYEMLKHNALLHARGKSSKEERAYIITVQGIFERSLYIRAELGH